MAEYDSKSVIAKQMRGVHLFHNEHSNCSQRCRLVLETKSIEWTSHHFDLSKNEHLTPEYLEINPNGLVPALVHDGRVILESNDIISYLDNIFPDPALLPDDRNDRWAVASLLNEAGNAQLALKTLSHEYLFSDRRKFTSRSDILEMKRSGASGDLISFLSDYQENSYSWKERLEQSTVHIMNCLNTLEERLSITGYWLSGIQIGLADISWIVNYYRLYQCNFDLDAFPLTVKWGQRIIRTRPFNKAVAGYHP